MEYCTIQDAGLSTWSNSKKNSCLFVTTLQFSRHLNLNKTSSHRRLQQNLHTVLIMAHLPAAMASYKSSALI